MTDNAHPSVAHHERLRQHVHELAKAFGVRLVVQKIDPANAGAGHVATVCPSCGIVVTLPDHAAGKRVRCGACKTDLGVAPSVNRLVSIAEVIDESTYAVALHELGHCLAPTGMLTKEKSRTCQETRQPTTLRDVRLLIEEETAAWTWAQHHALEWTELMERVHQFSIQSYLKEARRFGV